MSGLDIRTFFRELFGSRLVERLEMDILQLRSDFENRLQDKERVIVDLRAEIALHQAKTALYERTLLPYASKQGADIVASTKPTKPSFAGMDFSSIGVKTKWQVEQEKWEQQLRAEEEAEKAKAATK